MGCCSPSHTPAVSHAPGDNETSSVMSRHQRSLEKPTSAETGVMGRALHGGSLLYHYILEPNNTLLTGSLNLSKYFPSLIIFFFRCDLAHPCTWYNDTEAVSELQIRPKGQYWSHKVSAGQVCYYYSSHPNTLSASSEREWRGKKVIHLPSCLFSVFALFSLSCPVFQQRDELCDAPGTVCHQRSSSGKA